MTTFRLLNFGLDDLVVKLDKDQINLKQVLICLRYTI